MRSYNGLDAADVTVTNTDNDTAGITVSHQRRHDEAGGTATFTVVLDSQPTADVTIAPHQQRPDRRHGLVRPR